MEDDKDIDLSKLADLSGLEKYGKIGKAISKATIEDKLAAVFLIVVAVFLLIQVSQFQHIPSPVYGGDFYMARGFTQAILEGRPFYEDPYFGGPSIDGSSAGGGYAYYGWLSYLLTAGIVKLTGVGLERVSIVLPVFIHLAFLLACYLFGSAFFKSKKYGLLMMLAALAFRLVDMKMSGALAMVFSLLSLYSFVRFEQGSKRHGWLLGIFMGLTALSHINIFFGLVILVAIAIIGEFIIRLWSMNWLKTIGHYIRRYTPIALIAILIALALVGPWIFYHHMQILNPAQEYSTQDVTKLNFAWVGKIMLDLFFRAGFFQLIYGLFMLLGLLYCILNRKSLEPKLAMFWLAGAFIGLGHFLITIPLLGTWSVPGYLYAATVWIVELTLFIYGVKNIGLMLKKSGLGEKAMTGAFIAGIILLALIFSQTFTNFQNDRWMQFGRQMDAGSAILFDTEKWILANTNPEDTFLANDESAFALNALSGRKVVMSRRTHASYYIDVEQRYADGIVMLYGQDKNMTLELIEKYSLDYLYLDSFLFSYPMIVDKRFSAYLDENGVNYTMQQSRLDPAAPEAPVYDVLIVQPTEPTIIGFNLTEPVQQFTHQNQLHSMILRVI